MHEANAVTVSVVMPAYNAEKYISAAIESVMAQTYSAWELIIIDDGSSDKTFQISKDYTARDCRIRCYQQGSRSGVAAARNRGIAVAKGEYVAFLDSDDIWLPHKLESQLQLAQQTGAALMFSSYSVIDADGRREYGEYVVPETVDFEALLRENVIGCSTVLVRASVLKEHRFQPGCYHEDYLLWLQILRSGQSARGCKQILSCWRRMPGSHSYNKVKSGFHRWRIYRRYLGFPIFQSMRYFASYVLRGVKKYRKMIGR